MGLLYAYCPTCYKEICTGIDTDGDSTQLIVGEQANIFCQACGFERQINVAEMFFKPSDDDGERHSFGLPPRMTRRNRRRPTPL